MPIQNPAAAGTKAHFLMLSACCIAGISRLQMEAAVITPPANPVRAFCRPCRRSRFMKNTQADPAAVPRNGIRRHVSVSAFIYAILFSFPCSFLQGFPGL